MPIDYKAEFQDVEILQRQSDYLINNTAYPRVSSILSVINKPALVNWARGYSRIIRCSWQHRQQVNYRTSLKIRSGERGWKLP